MELHSKESSQPVTMTRKHPVESPKETTSIWRQPSMAVLLDKLYSQLVRRRRARSTKLMEFLRVPSQRHSITLAVMMELSRTFCCIKAWRLQIEAPNHNGEEPPVKEQAHTTETSILASTQKLSRTSKLRIIKVTIIKDQEHSFSTISIIKR
jgi:hypothetical protein